MYSYAICSAHHDELNIINCQLILYFVDICRLMKKIVSISLFIGICTLFLFQSCHHNSNSVNNTDHKYTNKLIDETSPYLLQHAHNPVDWHAWNEESLQKAKDENKLLIISIGYAACHWCHVMEHESFEDTLVAKLMNEHFLPIKVDREERPDVDDVYMTACNLISGRGGWPLNAFALPDGRPVWAGTYFPKDQWINILNQFIKLKESDPQKLEESADQITKGVQSSDQIALVENKSEFTSDNLKIIGQNFNTQLDLNNGGRQGAPKFPMPNNYEFLLKYQHLTGDQNSKKALDLTLEKMAWGGIYDQIGGGFARYSTDEIWKVPHFEKMLYDNGQLVSLYAQAYRADPKPLYEQVVRETLSWIEREMTTDEGGFYSSLDADSEGIEGKFYVWNTNEMDSLLGDQAMSEVIKDYYEMTEEGNWEESNILFRKQSKEEVAKNHNISTKTLDDYLVKAKSILLKERGNRIRPGLDDKILTSWNALMLRGYTEAYRTLGDPAYLDAALKNAYFIVREQMKDDGQLNRNFKDGKSSINGFLDDYANTIDAFIQLYQVTFDMKWLDYSDKLTSYVLDHFISTENKMFNYTSDLDPALIARKMEVNDNVIPASNSVMARNLKYLGELLYNNEYLGLSEQMLHNLHDGIVSISQPSFYSNWCQLYLDMVYPPYEIAIVGDDYESKRGEFMKKFIPNALFLGGSEEGKLELLKNKLAEGVTMIYVCQNKACKLPVQEVSTALDLIK